MLFRCFLNFPFILFSPRFLVMKKPLSFKRISLLLFICLCNIAAFAQEDAANWTLVRENDGIKIFTRPNTDRTNPIDEVKGEVVFTGNIDATFAIVSDMSKFALTDEIVSSIEKLDRKDDRYTYYYQIGRTPFFMKDRDFVLRASSTKTSQGYFICIEAINDTTLMPLSKDYKRMNDMVVYVSLQQNPDNQSFKLSYKITYKLEEGMDGGIIINTYNKLSITSTYSRLVNLQKLISSELQTSSRK